MDDDALMLAFLAGDRTAFDALFDRYREPVWIFFRRRVAVSPGVPRAPAVSDVPDVTVCGRPRSG